MKSDDKRLLKPVVSKKPSFPGGGGGVNDTP